MIYLVIQVTALLFAYCCGRHDVPAVDNFSYYGSKPKHQADFHDYNFGLKSCFVIAICILSLVIDVSTGIPLTVSCAAIIYGLFDPVIAIFRTVYTPPKKPWYYLSKKVYLDNLLLNMMGEKAGIYKAVFCAAVVLVMNLIIFL